MTTLIQDTNALHPKSKKGGTRIAFVHTNGLMGHYAMCLNQNPPLIICQCIQLILELLVIIHLNIGHQAIHEHRERKRT